MSGVLRRAIGWHPHGITQWPPNYAMPGYFQQTRDTSNGKFAPNHSTCRQCLLLPGTQRIRSWDQQAREALGSRNLPRRKQEKGRRRGCHHPQRGSSASLGRGRHVGFEVLPGAKELWFLPSSDLVVLGVIRCSVPCERGDLRPSRQRSTCPT